MGTVMRATRIPCLLTVAVSLCGAATWQEDFSTDPASNGWEIHGDESLFSWNSTNQTLEVTWDSSQSNSYFHKSLETIVARSDDFSFEFDLRMTDIAVGVNTNKPFAFQLAVGLTQLTSATSTNLRRGTGINAEHGPRNLVEFDYFPDSGFGATISPTIVSSNNQFASRFAFPLEIDPGAQFQVLMNYTASNQTLRTTMTRNGEPFGPIQNVLLGGNFTDFRIDHFAICSYSDEGADGSLLAHGVVDNISVTVPDPPVRMISGSFSNEVWQVGFQSRSNWLYALERSTDASAWTQVTDAAAGTGELLELMEGNPPTTNALYRVHAERP